MQLGLIAFEMDEADGVLKRGRRVLDGQGGSFRPRQPYCRYYRHSQKNADQISIGHQILLMLDRLAARFDAGRAVSPAPREHRPAGQNQSFGDSS